MRLGPKLALCLMLAANVCGAAGQGDAKSVAAQVSSPGVVYVATLQNGFSIRFDHYRQQDAVSRLFLTADESSFLDLPTAQIAGWSDEKLPSEPAETPKTPVVDIPKAITTASDRHGIDADLLYSVIRAESGFNPRAVSKKGAQGLMQLMPGTAGQLGVKDSFDTQANVDAGTRYLRTLLDRYRYDLAKALAAYNAGPERVDHYRGVPPFHETRVYVARIIREYNQKKLGQMAAEKKARDSKKTATPVPARPAGS